jgi:hypothetical protein
MGSGQSLTKFAFIRMQKAVWHDTVGPHGGSSRM